LLIDMGSVVEEIIIFCEAEETKKTDINITKKMIINLFSICFYKFILHIYFTIKCLLNRYQQKK